jgi:hypothetical protein
MNFLCTKIVHSEVYLYIIICILWLIPHPVVTSTDLWIHGMYVCMYVCMYVRMYYVCMYVCMYVCKEYEPLSVIASLYYSVSPFPSSWQSLHLVKYYEIAVTSLAPRPGYEVVTPEHRRRSAWTSEEPADPLTYLHIALRIRTMTATNCERRR